MSSYIEGISQATTASSASSSTSATDDQNSMGKEDFLTLLVAQLQNQDPLNPDDPTEFTAQLAQFSSLEQLFTLNESMDNLAASYASSDRVSSLSTIGKEVTYFGDTFEYADTPVEIGYQLDEVADSVTLSLQQNGVTVATLKGTELGEGSHFITWDGLTDEGENAPAGEYTVVVSASSEDGESIGVAPLVKSEVTGVDMEGESGGTLITQSGSVDFDDILGIYEPGSSVTTTATDEDEENTQDALNSAVALTETLTENDTETDTEIIE